MVCGGIGGLSKGSTCRNYTTRSWRLEEKACVLQKRLKLVYETQDIYSAEKSPKSFISHVLLPRRRRSLCPVPLVSCLFTGCIPSFPTTTMSSTPHWRRTTGYSIFTAIFHITFGTAIIITLIIFVINFFRPSFHEKDQSQSTRPRLRKQISLKTLSTILTGSSLLSYSFYACIAIANTHSSLSNNSPGYSCSSLCICGYVSNCIAKSCIYAVFNVRLRLTFQESAYGYKQNALTLIWVAILCGFAFQLFLIATAVTYRRTQALSPFFPQPLLSFSPFFLAHPKTPKHATCSY